MSAVASEDRDRLSDDRGFPGVRYIGALARLNTSGLIGSGVLHRRTRGRPEVAAVIGRSRPEAHPSLNGTFRMGVAGGLSAALRVMDPRGQPMANANDRG